MAGVNEVAKAAGVSIATVSRVINQPELVAPATRDRVSEAMKKLNYRVNSAASALRRGHAKTIALVVANMSQPWYVKLVRALRTEIGSRGYTSVIFDLEHDPRVLVDYLGGVENQGISGVILATGDFLDTPEIINAMTRAHQTTPLVVIGQHVEDATWPTVRFNDEHWSYEATRVLLQRSHGHIAFLGRCVTSYLAGERLKGFRRAVDEQPDAHGIVWDINDFGFAAGYREMTQAIERGETPTAVLCVNDELALGVTRAAAEHRLRVPSDLAVMGYGNTDFLEYVLPSLSSVDGSAVTAASVAFNELWDYFSGNGTTRTTVLERRLVLRESTGHSVTAAGTH
ncbi:LacI family DNA-binding transcriptional regulator [Saccharopolyspora hattusasensis]|uniref:LacI family DNA-binding transcriptional regulator n=1 Tax=Saccharopolyspora hattusasensis TaxID=1128679 RepID=UPI003D964A8E